MYFCDGVECIEFQQKTTSIDRGFTRFYSLDWYASTLHKSSKSCICTDCFLLVFYTFLLRFVC